MGAGAIIFNQLPKLDADDENLNGTLASMTSELLLMQELLGQKELEINDLRKSLDETYMQKEINPKTDQTLSLVGALIKLYKFFILPKGAD